jgi:DNA-binding NarL/FixJ family response regulator
VDAPGIVNAVVAAGPGARAAIRRSLAAAGVQVADFYGDVEAAIAAARRDNPQLCVLDRDLPGGGIAAIAAITVPGPRTRVVVLGGETPAEVRAARLAGADECIPQAAGANDLAASITAAHQRRNTPC